VGASSWYRRKTVMASTAPAPIRIELRSEGFVPYRELADWPSADGGPKAPAEAVFIGRVRGQGAAGQALEALELEHYPGMTERQLRRLAEASCADPAVRQVLVLHRIGRMAPGEAIVLVAVRAERRGPAQRCGQALLEALKHEAPFWKREWSGDGGSWVLGNTPLAEAQAPLNPGS
jgi:molybdopterin synthase catalytic subunit